MRIETNPKLPKFHFNLLRNAPPYGYRFLEDHEIILKTDFYYGGIKGSERYISTPGPIGDRVSMLSWLKQSDYIHCGYIRKLDK